jgi:hypothetical protein
MARPEPWDLAITDLNNKYPFQPVGMYYLSFTAAPLKPAMAHFPAGKFGNNYHLLKNDIGKNLSLYHSVFPTCIDKGYL